jgi:hypothetical protein
MGSALRNGMPRLASLTPSLISGTAVLAIEAITALAAIN